MDTNLAATILARARDFEEQAKRNSEIDLNVVYGFIQDCAVARRPEVLPALEVLGRLSGKGRMSILTHDYNWGEIKNVEFDNLPLCMEVYFHLAAFLGLFDKIFEHLSSSSPLCSMAEEIFDRQCGVRAPRHGGYEVYDPQLDRELGVRDFHLPVHGEWHNTGKIQKAWVDNKSRYEHTDWWARIGDILRVRVCPAGHKLRLPLNKRGRVTCPVCQRTFVTAT